MGQPVLNETHLRAKQPTEELCRLYHGIQCAICGFVECGEAAHWYGGFRPCGRPIKHTGEHSVRPIRGVDVACEDCGKLAGYFLDDGWYRCKACGYPGK